jgi:hypothetical protein
VNACNFHSRGHNTLSLHETINGTTTINTLDLQETSGCDVIDQDLSKVRGVLRATYTLAPSLQPSTFAVPRRTTTCLT